MQFGSKDFFQYYEAAHQNPMNRYVHHCTHSLAVAGIAILPFMLFICLALIALAFSFSWAGHYLFEHNTLAFFETDQLNGVRESVYRHIKIAVGGVLWTLVCFLRLFQLEPSGQIELETEL